MNGLDYESVLLDRVAKIQAINKQYDLEHNGYISFSGGKDSVVNHYLFDLALPNNHIPRVFINTGVEYNAIRKFAKNLSLNDKRIQIINSNVNIKKMLKNDGYPFKSKQHAHNWMLYYNNTNELDSVIQKLNEHPELQMNYDYIHNLPKGIKTNIKYIFGLREKETRNSVVERERESSIVNSIAILTCPECLRYQFTKEFKEGDLKLSDKCCYRLKKEVFHKWMENNNKSIAITGIRGAEGGMRGLVGCTIFKDNKLIKFHPLQVISDEWEDEFIKRNNIQLCELYYPPYNFKRTGCKGCPFALDLQKQLLVMKKLLPNEYKQCLHLWKPVYDEYIRLGYRLSKDFYDIKPQYTIEDYLGEEE